MASRLSNVARALILQKIINVRMAKEIDGRLLRWRRGPWRGRWERDGDAGDYVLRIIVDRNELQRVA
jgi:hypothetical protein